LNCPEIHDRYLTKKLGQWRPHWEIVMAIFEWSDRFSVRVREIDEQHEQLVAMINRLHDAMVANKGRELQQEIVRDMVAYTDFHFATEEKYMRSFGYAGYFEHKTEHEQFSAEAAELKARVDRGGLVLSLEVMTVLKEWLQNHILGTDMKYAGLFNANGLD
jgi:hemerythrin